MEGSRTRGGSPSLFLGHDFFQGFWAWGGFGNQVSELAKGESMPSEEHGCPDRLWKTLAFRSALVAAFLVGCGGQPPSPDAPRKGDEGPATEEMRPITPKSAVGEGFIEIQPPAGLAFEHRRRQLSLETHRSESSQIRSKKRYLTS